MPAIEIGRYKRSILFIEKDFQRRFIIKFCFLALAAMVLSSLLLYIMEGDTITAVYADSHLSLERTGSAIVKSLIVTNIAVLLGLLGATTWLSLHISFKIGGPLFAVKRDIAEVGQGKLTKRVKFRSGDQLVNLAGSMNEMIENLEWRIEDLKDVTIGLKTLPEYQSLPEPVKFKIEEIGAKLDKYFTTQQKTEKFPPAETVFPSIFSSKTDRQANILVVDDNHANSSLCKEIVTRMGHAAILVDNGPEALEILKSQAFDLVLMDIFMPGMDGKKVTELIRNTADLPGNNAAVPIIAVTAHSSPNSASEFIAAGMNGFLAKPFDIRNMVHEINKHLGHIKI